jgi:hypothetical protein
MGRKPDHSLANSIVRMAIENVKISNSFFGKVWTSHGAVESNL